MIPQQPVPKPLARLLQTHAAAYAPHYPPSDNADHGPMAYLAMHGLGIGFEAINTFANSYRRKLIAFSPPNETVSEDQWRMHIGQRRSYSALLEFFNTQIARNGWESTVARYLPELISGWVKDAFHPLIRLSYGIEFRVSSEISAGLAYMTITGDDPSLAAFADNQPTNLQGREYFQFIRTMRQPEFSSGPFNSRYRRITRGTNLAPVDGAAVTPKILSRICLEAFHATHDFFALHLVTSSHAFRICSPWAGANAQTLYSVGLAAAYLAIDAPEFAALGDSAELIAIDALARTTDEHDIKLAHSARTLARTDDDPTYEWVAARYLAPRLSAAD